MRGQKNSFLIEVRTASDRENAEAVTDTIMLAFDRENNMLPYLDRVVKMFPEIPSPVSPEMERETILPIVEDLIREKKQAGRQRIQEQTRRFQELAWGSSGRRGVGNAGNVSAPLFRSPEIHLLAGAL